MIDEKLIYDDIKGPSWSPEKKLKKLKFKRIKMKKKITDINLESLNKLQKTLLELLCYKSL